MSAIQIPTFSLEDLGNGSHRTDLRQCIQEYGIFYLTEYGMTDADHRLARDAAMNVFEHATPEEKQALTTRFSDIRRGFSGLGAESTALVTNTGSYSDYSMCFSMGLSDNLFPSPDFENVWTQYFSLLYNTAQAAAQVVLQVSNVDCELDDLINGDPVLRLRYFPEVPPDRVAECEPLRMAPHYDLSVLTLIHQTECENGFVSLQVQIGDEIVGLPPKPESVVVLCGAVATLASHGVVRAPKHQVAAPPSAMQAGSGRTSSVFFLRPRPTYTFSVANAHKFGLDVSVTGETATFGDWIGINYEELHTRPDARVNLERNE